MKVKKDHGSWVNRLRKHHPLSLLLYIALMALGDGMSGMLRLSMQNIFKEKYHVEPSDLQKYSAAISSPIFFRVVFGIIIDAKIVSKRKYYVVMVNILAAIPVYLIAIEKCSSPAIMALYLFLFSIGHQILEAVVSSISVEQARKDIECGQEDIQSLRSLFMGIGFPLGSVIATYTIEIGRPLIPFLLVFAFSLLMAAQALFLSDDIENNQYATIKDKELLRYE